MSDNALLPGGEITGIGNSASPWQQVVANVIQANLKLSDGTHEVTVAELRERLDSGASGSGDMSLSVYDPDGDGKVVAAQTADTATTAASAATADALSGAAGAGASKYYGTDAAGAAGFHDLPAGGSGGAPAAHAATHATVGSDPLTPSAIGAAAAAHAHTISGVTGLLAALEAKADTAHAHADAAAQSAGFLSAADKVKLDGIDPGAQVNAITSVNGYAGTVVLGKSDLGLGSVDNTSDADKPVSTAMQTALNAKAAAVHTHNSASTSGTGFLPQLPGDSAKFLDGTGAWVSISSSGGGRILLSAPLTVYVATTGSDSNDGLTAGTPKQTIQAAWNLLASSYDLGGQDVTIRLLDGNYADRLVGNGKMCGQMSPVILSGNTAAPANVTLTHSTATTIQAVDGAAIELRGMTISNTSSYSGVQAVNATVYIGAGIVFNTCSGNGQLFADTNGMIFIKNSYSITGGGVRHFLVWVTGTISAVVGASPVVTVASGVTYSGQFAYVVTGGVLQSGAITYSYTTVTGSRYYVRGNGVIWTGGGGANYLPGNAAGSTADGGIYV